MYRNKYSKHNLSATAMTASCDRKPGVGSAEIAAEKLQELRAERLAKKRVAERRRAMPLVFEIVKYVLLSMVIAGTRIGYVNLNTRRRRSVCRNF